MTTDEIINELSTALRHLLRDTTLKNGSEDDFSNLACQLILAVSKTIAIKPLLACDYADSSMRIFEIFTRWLRAHPDHVIRISTSSDRFQVAAINPKGMRLCFGESAQDACAQIAQTICFEEVS